MTDQKYNRRVGVSNQSNTSQYEDDSHLKLKKSCVNSWKNYLVIIDGFQILI